MTKTAISVPRLNDLSRRRQLFLRSTLLFIPKFDRRLAINKNKAWLSRARPHGKDYKTSALPARD